jgi:hypothetical protein
MYSAYNMCGCGGKPTMPIITPPAPTTNTNTENGNNSNTVSLPLTIVPTTQDNNNGEKFYIGIIR